VAFGFDVPASLALLDMAGDMVSDAITARLTLLLFNVASVMEEHCH
jgi:hypothetical protein